MFLVGLHERDRWREREMLDPIGLSHVFYLYSLLVQYLSPPISLFDPCL